MGQKPGLLGRDGGQKELRARGCHDEQRDASQPQQGCPEQPDTGNGPAGKHLPHRQRNAGVDRYGPFPQHSSKAAGPRPEAVDQKAPEHSFPADYKGKWVILFSHPADFTPICTTEILTFGARTEEFRALNCELVGLSVDSRNSHIAWLRTIRDRIEYRGMKGVRVEFPIIDDVGMKVASLYGMIQPGESETAAVRAVFFIDPTGVLRAMICYPLALGRNFDEIERVLIGLQTIDGATYYFDKNGNKVTGTQVIQGIQYTFSSEGKVSNNRLTSNSKSP